jgi:ubiquinone biosynthesis protein
MISLSNNKIDFKRLKEIINLLIKYNFDNLVGEMKLKGSRWSDLFSKYNSDIDLNATAPERLRLVFEELGPTFIKLGQMMSTRPDLVGPEMSDEFTKLQDNTIPIEFKTIKSIVEQELGKPLKEAFQTFDEEQLATASIGQVHRATLQDNSKVAVKIQKPGIQDTVKKDIAIMHHLANIIDKRISRLKYLNIPGIVDEFEKSMYKEMDYQLEARNTQNFQNNFQDDNGIHVPQIYPD